METKKLTTAVKFICELRKTYDEPLTGEQIYDLYSNATTPHLTCGRKHFINLLLLHGFSQNMVAYTKEDGKRTTTILYDYEEGSGVY